MVFYILSLFTMHISIFSDICTKLKSSILKHLGMSKTRATATKTSATCSESADTNCKSSAYTEKKSQENSPRELEARSEASNENDKKKKDSKQSGIKRIVQQATSFIKKSEMSKVEEAVSEHADDTDSPSVSKVADNEQADTNITKSQGKGGVNFSIKRKHKVFKSKTFFEKDEMSRPIARVSQQAKSTDTPTFSMETESQQIYRDTKGTKSKNKEGIIFVKRNQERKYEQDPFCRKEKMPKVPFTGSKQTSTNDYSACDKKTMNEEEDIDIKPGRKDLNFGKINAELARKKKTVNELKPSRSQDVVASDEMLGKFKNIKEREDKECREMSTGFKSKIQTSRNYIAQRQRNIRKPNSLQKSISVCHENKNETTADSETKQNLTGMVRKNTWPLLSRGSTAHHIATRLEGHDKQPENRGRERLYRTRHASQSKHFNTSWRTHRNYSSSHQYEYMPESMEEEGEEKYTFFWRKYSPFSQHHACNFVIDGVTYNCAEQYMMYRKAGKLSKN